MVTANIAHDAFELGLLQWIFNHFTGSSAWGMITSDGPSNLKLVLLKGDARSLTGVMPAIGGVGSLEPTSAEYQSYARLAVPRTAAEWACATLASVSMAAKATNDAVFATAGGASTGCLITHVGVALEASAYNGATGDFLIYCWELDNPISVSAGIAPRINVGDLVHEEK